MSEHVIAGWELRCGDDGSEWSRSTLTNPSKPSCRRTPSRPPFAGRVCARRHAAVLFEGSCGSVVL